MGGPGPTLLSELPRQIAGCIATYTRPTDMATLPIMGRGSITACVITMRGQPIMPPRYYGWNRGYYRQSYYW